MDQRGHQIPKYGTRYGMDDFRLQDQQFLQVTGKCIAPNDIAIMHIKPLNDWHNVRSASLGKKLLSLRNNLTHLVSLLTH